MELLLLLSLYIELNLLSQTYIHFIVDIGRWEGVIETIFTKVLFAQYLLKYNKQVSTNE